MQEIEKKQITPVEAAAAMMQFTMKSIENGWETIRPVFTAFLTEPALSQAKEDELLREIYIAALALEIYCIPHAFDKETASIVLSGMNEVMASENLVSHQLSAPINEQYLPKFEAVNGEDPADLALALVEEAASILYKRLELPLKPADPDKSMLWAKLFPFLAGHVGKWPILQAKFTIQSE
ncbi:hypothetical protein [Paenibacillus sedimenti]|uniref:Uncharacterized protein n=1 Tax=Paenibacillus sedimenti TaxID=2770274 RepID=A0A926KQL2_9BACL|nr:hypothetical protein [Paenibacillus sedimenti]MBD0380414.1 hypothetical protein [Paenibacillus sedimenti]